MFPCFLLWPCSKLPVREQIGIPVVILVLLVFIGVGVHAVIHPKRHMNKYLRSGGQMRQELNQTGIQFGGLIFVGVSAWTLVELLRSVWDSCLGPSR